MPEKVSKNNENNNKSSDFFTEIVLDFSFKNKEYKVKLGVQGVLQIHLGKLIPKITKFEILKVIHQNKKIKCPPGLDKYIKRWIANNPEKFNMFLASELSIMTLLTSKSSNNTPLRNNTIDKV